jgi:hypothetical protein
VNESWFSNNVVRVVPPWKMLYAGKPIASIAFDKKCATELALALDAIWDACNKDYRIIKKKRSARIRWLV